MSLPRSSAINDYRRARRRAAMQELLGRLGGKSQDLLSFDEARRAVGEVGQFPRGLQDIPLDAIVGSVGRYEDFNRQFLPRHQISPGRWAGVRMAAEDKGLPPIEVFKLGEVFFVHDGHHRVSVARQLGAQSIEAYVTEIPTKAPLTPDDDAEDLILKAEQTAFLEDTRLNELRPEVDLILTNAGRYRQLREHIAVHQYFMGLDQQREISFGEAVEHWVDEVYLPAVEAIRSLDWLGDFPGRSEADMYLWLMKHRADLVEELGWQLNPQESAADLLGRFGRHPRRVLRRIWERVYDFLTPDTLETGPPTGEWRREREGVESLFGRVLVAISGVDPDWTALEQAIVLAQREGAEVRGVHVLAKGETKDNLQSVQVEFERRLAAAELSGRLVFERGPIARGVERRARWSDIVVVHVAHPPGSKAIERLRSGMRALVQRMPRPVLAVSQATAMQHALLAFDGGLKSTEALNLSAYYARRWGVQLTVLTSKEKGVSSLVQGRARDYLEEQGVQAHYETRRGSPGEELVALAAARGCDFILMGGYGQAPLVEVVLGSTVDHVLREFEGPVLICR